MSFFSTCLLNIPAAGLFLTGVFTLLSALLIVFVLFRQSESGGLGGAFGGAQLSGEGAFGAKSAKVVDSVVSWMCVLFIVLSLLLARIATSDASQVEKSGETTTSEESTDSSE